VVKKMDKLMSGEWLGFKYEIKSEKVDCDRYEAMGIAYYPNNYLWRQGVIGGSKELLLEWMFRTFKLYTSANIFIKFILLLRKDVSEGKGIKKLFGKIYILED